MEMNSESRRHAVDVALVTVVLVAVAVGLGVQIAIASRAAVEASPPAQRHFGRLARIALLLLAIDLLAMFWLGIRVLALRFRSREPRQGRVPYVDAWSVAGKRFRMDEEDEAEEGPSDAPDPPK
jgi:hypothetical protein